jgi:hypothetical protein
MEGLKLVVLGVGVFITIAVGTYAYGAVRWAQDTRLLLSRLEAARLPLAQTRYAVRDLEGLPAPVQRYFRTALKEGQPIIAAVSVDHAGTFNMGEGVDSWKTFMSSQRVTIRPPGFVWNGRGSMMPGIPVRVHDAYVAGEGILRPAILGLFNLADMHGTGEIAQGELMRFFAEAAWYPTALLPSQSVSWEAVDDHSAKATLTDGTIRLSMLFRFAEDGLIESVRAEARGRTVGKTIVMTPWEGRWADYREESGMRVPMSGEVAWLTSNGPKPYWRGRIIKLSYEFVQ